MKELFIAGGCFWGVQAYYDMLKGVTFTEAGYANGNKENPTYEDLLTGKATHVELVFIRYAPEVISLRTILTHYFRFIDPYAVNRQASDIGRQYRSGLYFSDIKDKAIIENYIRDFEKKRGRKTAIEVEALTNDYPAEAYHQHYLKKNPNGYCHIDLGLIKDEEKK